MFYIGKPNSKEHREVSQGESDVIETAVIETHSVRDIIPPNVKHAVRLRVEKMPYFHTLDCKEKLFLTCSQKNTMAENIDLTFLGFDNYPFHCHLQWQLKYTVRYTALCLFLSVHSRRERKKKRKRSAAVFFVFHLACLMGADSRRSQLRTTTRTGRGEGSGCRGAEIESARWRGGFFFLRRREPFNPRRACRLQKMGVGADGWARAADMTGHPGYYLHPDGVKTKRVNKR